MERERECAECADALAKIRLPNAHTISGREHPDALRNFFFDGNKNEIAERGDAAA
jgi:hypothetical protein